MNVWQTLRNPRKGWKGYRAAWVALSLGAAAAAAWAVAAVADWAALGEAFRNLARDPRWLTAGMILFGAAFLIRAAIWRRMVPGLTLGHAWAAIHVALLGNHLLPFRLGEPLRPLSVRRRAGLPLGAAVSSTLTLRSADLLALLGLAWLTGAANLPLFRSTAVGGAAAAAVAALAGGFFWSRRRRSGGWLRRPDLWTFLGAALAWTAEAGLVYAAARAAGIHLTLSGAVLVTAVSVAAQIAALTPGGFGVYEAGAVAAYVYLGADPAAGLIAALAAHSLKTAYSIAAGAVAGAVPPPSLAGRWRLPRRLPSPPPPIPAPDGPVALFMPAYNEEQSVGETAGRIPETAAGRPVIATVVDDGSDDATAERAAAAGARVVSLPGNLGLGAAVRAGLACAVEQGAAAVAFCDADGEYSPEELERLTAPILAGEADYVVGSRFRGEIRRMLPHRRAGNRLLSLAMSLAARRRITDGQSGYRALSREAAARAEIIHDYNYAQVLTLNLLGQGFRYREVPISYGFRTAGTSFVRLLPYLRRVIPAVYRELNRPGPDQANNPSPKNRPSSGTPGKAKKNPPPSGKMYSSNGSPDSRS